MDINNPIATTIEGEDSAYKTNVKDGEHPIYSSVGLIETINFCRKRGNTSEKQLSGEIQQEVFDEVFKVTMNTKVPSDIILFCMDWEKDITSGGGNANSVAQKILQYVPEIRSSMGRDPTYSEILLAFAMNGGSKVKKWYDLAQNKPEEEAQPEGTQKDNIIFKKMRNGQEVKRVNREVYDFFSRRINMGRATFRQLTGNTRTYT